MKKIILIIILLCLQSCYTVKKAQRQVIKANVNYPELVAGFCANTFPVKDSIVEKIKVVKGDEIIKYDTIKEIDCDSIVNDTIINNKISIRYKTIYRTDTIESVKEVFTENTAKVKALELENNRISLELASTKNDLEDTTAKKNKFRNYLFVLIALLGIGVFLRLKRIV